MLKSNSKKAKENLKSYIINHFDCSNYEPETEPETFEDIAQFIYCTFRAEKYNSKEDFRYYHLNEFNAFSDWCSGLPSILDTCYYYNRSAVQDLAHILEETETEKNRYSESEAEARLTQLIYRAIKRSVCPGYISPG